MQQKINKTFNKKSAPSFDLRAEAACAFGQYPQIASGVVFRDVSSGAIIAANKNVLADAKYIDNTSRDLNAASREYNNQKSAGCYTTRGMNFILFYPGSDVDFLPGVNSALQLHYIFRHELAHTLHPDARNNSNLSESVADSYAATYLLQHFGAQVVPLIEQLIEKRVQDVLQTPDDRITQEHFTAPALREVLAQYTSGTLDKDPLKAAGAIAAKTAIPAGKRDSDTARQARALKKSLK